MRPAALAARVVATALGLAACTRHSDEEAIRFEVQGLALEQGDVALRRAQRVADRFGRRAIPTIEQTLHTAEPPGRKNLVVALRRIGDGDAVPLLQHVAAFDESEDVRREAEWTLRSWAEEEGPRAEKARGAVRRVEELRGREGAG